MPAGITWGFIACSSGSAPLFKFTDPKLVRSASTIKERLLNWVQAQTKDYKVLFGLHAACCNVSLLCGFIVYKNNIKISV